MKKTRFTEAEILGILKNSMPAQPRRNSDADMTFTRTRFASDAINAVAQKRAV